MSVQSFFTLGALTLGLAIPASLLTQVTSAQETAVQEPVVQVPVALETVAQETVVVAQDAVAEVVDQAQAAVVKAAVVEAAAPVGANVDVDTALLGKPIVVNGEIISVNAIKRHLCLGTLGQPHIMNLKLKAYMDEEIGRRKSAGADVSVWDVSDADVQRAIDEAKANIAKEFPDNPDMKLEDVLPAHAGNFKDQVRQTQRFDLMFLPENPNEYPEITVMALSAGAQGTQLYNQLKDGWTERKRLEAAGEPAIDDPQSKGFLTMLLRQLVIKYLDDNAVVEAPETGLAVHMALRVNGQPILVDSIWGLIRDLISAQEVESSRSWLVSTTIARQALKDSGAWLNDEEFGIAYGLHSDPYKDSPFNIEMVATQFKKFPSANDYRMYFRISESFKKTILPTMTDEALLEHGKQRTNQIVGLGKIDADVILCSAYDFKTKSWTDGGWQKAEQKAIEVATALLEGTKSFDQCLEESSDFYDPPIAQSQKAQLQPNQLNNKGRFKNLSRNELLQKTFESEYSIFLNGNAVAEEIFFNLEVGSVGGPWKGPFGWYIARLNKRSPSDRVLTPADPNQRTLLEQEYLAARLNEFIQGLYDNAKIVGK